eukprot:5409652-Pyramimonas_sp.AAC.1
MAEGARRLRGGSRADSSAPPTCQRERAIAQHDAGNEGYREAMNHLVERAHVRNDGAKTACGPSGSRCELNSDVGPKWERNSRHVLRICARQQ